MLDQCPVVKPACLVFKKLRLLKGYHDLKVESAAFIFI